MDYEHHLVQNTVTNKKRAGNETRTRDLLLGKETFYQLNYARVFDLTRPRVPRARIGLATP